MDRSQVREFGLNRSIYSSKIMGMSSSVLHSPRSSTEREIHLRKSRIANIPETRNINLSEKLDFVVVFQAIEIERMAEEIETSRARIKEYERQLFNCDNYEIQIKELTEKCFRLESEKNSYREELFDNKRASQLIFNQLQEIKKRYVTVDFTTNEKYKLQKGRNDELIMEVEKWKARYNALDESKSKELQTIKCMMVEQSKSHLSRQTKQLFDRFDVEKEEMEQMIKNLRQVNIEKDTEMKKCKFQLENKDKMIDEMEKQVDQYEEKVALLSQENYRLSEMSKSKQNEIAKIKEKLKQSQETVIKLNQQITLKSDEIKKLSLKLKKIEETVNQKQGKLTKLQKISLNDKERLSQLDRIVFLLKERENEIQGKNKMIERKDKKIISLEEVVKNIQETETTTKQEITNMKQQSALASQTIQVLLKRIQQLSLTLQKVKQLTQTSFSSMETHNTSFRQEINKKTEQIMEYSHKLMGQIQENQKYITHLQDAMRKNTETIKTIERQKINALQKLEQLKEYETEYQSVEKENEKLKRMIDRLMEERNHLIEETQMKESQIMNQTQMQIRVIEDKYQNNIIKKIRQQITTKEKQNYELKNHLGNIERKLKEVERQSVTKEENCNKSMSVMESQFNSKYNTLVLQIKDKTDQLLKQQTLTKQLKNSLEILIKSYQTSIKTQLESLMSRIQPIENAIRALKIIVSEKLINQQKSFVQKQKIHQKQIHELIDMNSMLMEKNNRLYDAMIDGSGISDIISVSTSNNSKVIKRYNSQLEHITTNNTIYTSHIPSTKTISSPKATNQNHNTSNFIGIGTKIKETIKGSFSNQTSSNIPLEFLIKHVLLCAELESLRQRIGDKNAKVEKMRNSLMCSNVSSNKSFVAVVNGNTKVASQHIVQPQGEMMLQSNLMSSTLINKLTNPFMNSFVGNMNGESSFIHQSRLIEHTERYNGQQKDINIRRVISEKRYPPAASPDNSSILDNSQNKNTGIYTNRMSGSGIGFGRNGFKSIGIRKAKIYN